MVLSNAVFLHRLYHPHVWIGTWIFESQELHAASELVPKVSSSAFDAIEGPGNESLLSDVFNSKLWSTDDKMLLWGWILQIGVANIRRHNWHTANGSVGEYNSDDLPWNNSYIYWGFRIWSLMSVLDSSSFSGEVHLDCIYHVPTWINVSWRRSFPSL